MQSFGKTLILVPHPDDELLGVGGTLLRIKNKSFLLMTDGVGQRKGNLTKQYFSFEKSVEGLGQKKHEILSCNFPDQGLDKQDMNEIIKKVVLVINLKKPETILLPFFGDMNRDHRITFEAGMVASRFSHHHYLKRIFCYEIPSSTELSLKESFIPNTYVDVTKQAKKKLDLLKSCYPQELQERPGLRSIEYLQALMIKRGAEANTKMAEGLILIKQRW